VCAAMSAGLFHVLCACIGRASNTVAIMFVDNQIPRQGHDRLLVGAVI